MSTMPIQTPRAVLANPTALSVIGPAVTIGFFAAIFLWITFFVTHLPWVGMPPGLAIPVMLGVWLVAFGIGGTYIPRGRAAVGALAGAISAALGLLIVLSLLKAQQAADGSGSAGPQTPAYIAGFLCTGVVAGLVGVSLGGLAASGRSVDASSGAWLGRFAWVTVLAAAPLLFVGGLVTSTQSGMAVPDWPTTFGNNMFLYPLGPQVDPAVYLEHSHRLFGTLLGCATIVLAGWGVTRGPTRFARGLAVAALLGVVLQGVLGGVRVIENKTVLAMVHGVTAQLLFALLVMLAVHLSKGYFNVLHEPVQGARRAKFFATLAMHSLILQLLLGAAYRHLNRDGVRFPHILYTHAAFAFIVTFAAFMGAAVVWGLKDAKTGEALGPGNLLHRAAAWAATSVIVQFVLGWFAFGFGGKQLEAASVLQALIRTAHQANGAIVIGAVTAMFVAARAAWRASKDVAPA